MVYNVDEMIREVRVTIDQNMRDEQLLEIEDVDTLSLDEIIRGKIVDAIRLVEMEAPLQMLESGHDFGDCDTYIGEDGKGFIILPDDFMRLISFRMSDWERTVFDTIDENDSRYFHQSSRVKGICGTRQKPVVAIVRRAEGLVLEFYSCASDEATVTQADYIPFPKIEENNSIDVSDKCYRAAVYRAASLALASIGDSLSATMLEISKSLLQTL